MTEYVSEASDLQFVPGNWPLWCNYIGRVWVRDRLPLTDPHGEMVGFYYRFGVDQLLVFND